MCCSRGRPRRASSWTRRSRPWPFQSRRCGSSTASVRCRAGCKCSTWATGVPSAPTRESESPISSISSVPLPRFGTRRPSFSHQFPSNPKFKNPFDCRFRVVLFGRVNYRVLPGFTEFYWVLPSFTWCDWVSPILYLVIADFSWFLTFITWFKWVLTLFFSGLTTFYLVFIGFYIADLAHFKLDKLIR